MNENGKRPIPEMSAETRLLSELIGAMQVGDVLTYEKLSEHIGRDVRLHALSSLGSARKIAQRDFGVVVGVIRKVGIERMGDAGILGIVDQSVLRARRAFGRTAKTLRVADYARLTEAQQAEYNAKASTVAVIYRITSAKGQKSLATALQETRAELPVAKTLEFFKGNG